VRSLWIPRLPCLKTCVKFGLVNAAERGEHDPGMDGTPPQGCVTRDAR
jgi:hypothetical protein